MSCRSKVLDSLSSLFCFKTGKAKGYKYRPSPPLEIPNLDGLRSLKSHSLPCVSDQCSKIADHLYIGSEIVARDRELLRRNGITHVLNCAGSDCADHFRSDSDLVYRTLWLQDCIGEDLTSVLYDVFDYLEDVREQEGRVLVHCYLGVSRSSSLVIAYLMWQKGQSYIDAFSSVKATRAVTGPNEGFGLQLREFQKKLELDPRRPDPALRVYRMAPHSPHDPTHLVLKQVRNPSPKDLDSRGAFVVILPFLATYVWSGKNCEPVMAADAKDAAFQLVTYERIITTVLTIEEDREPTEFWVRFINDCSRYQESRHPIEIGGKGNVTAYDADFELFSKAIGGAVVPARASNWSALRRKSVSVILRDQEKKLMTSMETPLRFRSLPPSLAERKGFFPPLLTLPEDNSLTYGYFGCPEEAWVRRNCDHFLSKDDVQCECGVEQVQNFDFVAESADDCSGKNVGQLDENIVKDGPLLSDSRISIAAYRYPEMEKIATLGIEDLDSKAAFLFLTRNKDDDGKTDSTLYIWMGNGFKHDNGKPQLNNNIGADAGRINEIDWNEVGRRFLDSKGLRKDLPIKVVQEQEVEDFLDLLNSTMTISIKKI